MLESKFQTRITNRLEQYGYNTYLTEGRGTKGFPDVVAIRAGRVIFLELKRDNGVLSAHQEKFVKDVTKQGGEVFVCYPKNFEEIMSLCE